MTTETKQMPSEREIEAATEALARTALTPKGKIECVWPDDWSHEECAKLRNGAIAALTAASQSRTPDQSERVRELEAELRRWKAMYLRDTQKLIDALAEARKVIEPFDAADNGDWRALDLLLGHSGHGQFWRETFAAFRSRLTRNPESSK